MLEGIKILVDMSLLLAYHPRLIIHFKPVNENLSVLRLCIVNTFVLFTHFCPSLDDQGRLDNN